MANSLSPAFVRIQYNSAFGVHTMTIPTLAYDVTNDTFDVHSGGTIDADTMINALVTELLPFFPTTVSFNNFTIFTQATPTSDPLPQRTQTFVGFIGTAVTTAWVKATQFTLTFRTTLFGIFKLVLLDCDSGNNFELQTSSTTPSNFTDLIAELTSLGNGWAGRDNGRPQSYLQCAKTLNEKLRREYRMI